MAKRKYCGDPQCGCSTPAFSKPREALWFLQGRMAYAGVGEAVAKSYSEDLEEILLEYPVIVGLNKKGPSSELIEHIEKQQIPGLDQDQIRKVLLSAFSYLTQE